MPGWWVLVWSLADLRVEILTRLRYTCTDQTPTFFGCCTSNPCNGVGCPASDLRAAGMGTGSGPDSATNDSSYWPNVQCVHGQWWTCADQTPSFQGCCISNPCGGTGCPMGNLFPAELGTVSSAAPTASPSVTSASNTLQSMTSTASAAPVVTSTSTHLPSVNQSSGPKVATIAGGAAGGAFGGCLLLIIIVFAIWKCRRRERPIESAASDPAAEPQFGSKGLDPEISTYNNGQHFHLICGSLLTVFI
jgi:hypothetical protein